MLFSLFFLYYDLSSFFVFLIIDHYPSTRLDHYIYIYMNKFSLFNFQFKKTYPNIYGKRFPSPKLGSKNSRTPSIFNKVRSRFRWTAATISHKERFPLFSIRVIKTIETFFSLPLVSHHSHQFIGFEMSLSIYLWMDSSLPVIFTTDLKF